MGPTRTVARQPAQPERKTVVRPPVRTAVPLSTAQLLQRRLGNEGAAAFVARSSLRVSSPQDPAEKEAVAKASSVMRMADSSVPVSNISSGVQRCGCASCACGSAANSDTGVRRKESASPAHHEAPHDVSKQIQSSMAGGSPLPSGVRAFMEPRFGSDFSGVRVHTNDHAARLSANLDAHAFTVGNHIFFGNGKYQPESHAGKELIAHELTHTIQQGASAPHSTPTPQRDTVQRDVIQRDEDKRSWWEKLTDWGESVGWDMVRAVAPTAEPILRGGPSGLLDWLGQKISGAVDTAFDTLLAPVRGIAGVGDALSTWFNPLIVALQTAAGQIARNDCSPIREAADKLEKTAEAILTPIIEKLQPVVAKVKAVLNELWEKIGLPIWNWIKDYAAEQWENIKWLGNVIVSFYSWIWEKTAWIRAIAAKAWTWVKNLLGIGEGAEGENGILQWVQGKVEAAWNLLKAKLAPFQKELTEIAVGIGAVLVAISPAGPILAVAGAIAAAAPALRWIAVHWGKGDILIQARAYIEKTLIPPLLNAVHSLSAALHRMAASIIGVLTSFAASLTRAAGSLAGSILKFVVTAVQWLATQVAAVATWAEAKLAAVADWITAATGKLQAFLQQVVTVLSKLGAVLIDIYGLPIMLAEKVWNLIPACIRDPIVDFLGPIILRQIELFSELGKDNEAWQKTKADVMNLIHLVFKDHNLIGAVKAAFNLVLRVFNIPEDLLPKIAAKAMAAWDVVSKKPLDFIKNTVKAIGLGFKLLKDNWKTHLQFGLEGWLFGELAEKKISRPSSWSDPKAVFYFVLEVLGLTVDHIYDLIKTRVTHPEKVDAFRKRVGQVVRVVEWVDKAIDVTKSPVENARGMIDQGKEFGKQVLTGIAEWVTGKVLEELAILGAAAAASGGLSEVLDAIRRVYKVLVSVKRYLAGILNMVSSALDHVIELATGKWEPVGAILEGILHKGMPIVIGFLAEQVGLGGIGDAIRGIIDKIRAKWTKPSFWLIDKIKGGIETLVNLVQGAVQKLKDWWTQEVHFEADGEPHTLKFQGADASARLVIASNPTPVRDFLGKLGSQADIAAALKLDDDITATQKAIVAAEKVNDQAKVTSLTATLTTQLNDLSVILRSLMKGNDEGSEKRPLEIDYPKRRASSYQKIYIGPRVGEGNRVNQDWLRALVGQDKVTAQQDLIKKKPNLITAINAWNGVVRVLSPTILQDVDGKTVGLSDNIRELQPGKLIEYTEKEGTGGGGKINDVFKPYGFVPSSSGGEGLDGDHVVERQIGGPDELYNLWPLDRSENRSSGSIVKSLKCTYKNQQIEVHEARVQRGKTIYLLIRSTREGGG